jgi:hypothetical protein
MRFLNVDKWREVRNRGRKSLVRRLAVIGAAAGTTISLPLWWGAYQFHNAHMDSPKRVLIVFAAMLPVALSLLDAGVAFLVWSLNEHLFAKYTGAQAAAPN